MTMDSNVFKFPSNASRAQARKPRADAPIMLPSEAILDNRFSVTAENGRLRIERREVWWTAEAATNYWRRRIDFNSAIERAKSMGTPEGRSHPAAEERSPLVEKWRAAIVRQLLTPAWDVASVKWKQMAMAKDSYLGVKPERIERAIADDLAFLAAHPTKRSNSEAMAHRREFHDAMRQRIRDVAASRDLSDEEIKPALTLKHHEVAKFVEKHGVNWPWLLEGKGRMFESDPITLGPETTGSEIAAVVKTLRPADQETVRGMVREFLQEHDQ
jgi:hypothetical protein